MAAALKWQLRLQGKLGAVLVGADNDQRFYVCDTALLEEEAAEEAFIGFQVLGDDAQDVVCVAGGGEAGEDLGAVQYRLDKGVDGGRNRAGSA